MWTLKNCPRDIHMSMFCIELCWQSWVMTTIVNFVYFENCCFAEGVLFKMKMAAIGELLYKDGVHENELYRFW